MGLQEVEFSKKSSAEAMQRETELRKALETFRKDAESDMKALQDRVEQEKANLAKQVAALFTSFTGRLVPLRAVLKCDGGRTGVRPPCWSSFFWSDGR